MKMSELEELPLGTLVAIENWVTNDGQPHLGTLESAWRTSSRTGWAMIVDAHGQQWQMRDRYLRVATDTEREAFDRDKQRIAQQDAECERFAKVLGIARVDVRHARNIILSWDEAAAIVARLEKGEK